MLRFCCIDCSYFNYNNKLIKQKFGLQMGSPLAPILSDLVLEYLFDHCIPKFPVPPVFIKKYVDDVICYIHKDHIDNIYNIINNFNHNLKFTYEIENNNSINFLDLTLIKKGNQIITNWYCKSLSSNRLLNFYSNHPKYMKINVASSFINKVLMFGHESFYNQNINTINEILILNSFPKYLINDLINRELNKIQIHSQNSITSNVPNTNTQSNHTFSSIQYLPGVSENIKHNIKSHLQNHTISFKPIKTLKTHLFTKLKQKVEKHNRSGIVYRANCLYCDGVYIGQSGKKLQQRMQRHKYDYKNRFSLDSKTSAITHAIDTGHQFDFNNATILQSEQNKFKREIKESSHIYIHSNSAVNRKTDLNNLNQEYFNTLDVFSTSSKLSPLKHNHN